MSFKEEIEEVLELAYAGNWEVTYDEGNEEYVVVIRFPHVVIRNGAKSKDIHDIFFKFKLNSTRLTSNLHAMRTTFSLRDAKAGYIHSHVPRAGNLIYANAFATDTTRFRGCCTGSSEINMLQTELRAEYDRTKFEMYVFMIEAYAAWESREGGPYFRMSSVPTFTSNPEYKTHQSDVDRIKKDIINNLKDLPIKMEDKHGVKVLSIDYEDEEFYQVLSSKCGIRKYHRTGKWYNSIPVDDNSTIIDAVNKATKEYDNYFMFRDEKIYLRLLEENPTDVCTDAEEYESLLPTDAVKQACLELNVRLTKYYKKNGEKYKGGS